MYQTLNKNREMGQAISGMYIIRSRHQKTNPKLEAWKVIEFSGAFKEWSKWESRMVCAFYGNDYKLILMDRVFVNDNLEMNRMVYA